MTNKYDGDDVHVIQEMNDEDNLSESEKQGAGALNQILRRQNVLADKKRGVVRGESSHLLRRSSAFNG